MFTTSPAIVLNRVKHSDSTLVVSLYTEAMGTVAFAVRIPKTSRASIKPTLFQPLNILTIEWDHRPNQNLQRLRNCHVLTPYSTISYEPQKAIIATFLAEVVHHSLKEEHQGELFPFLQNSLMWLDCTKAGYEDFHIVFLIKFARFLGFQPNIDEHDERPYFDLVNAEYADAQPLHNFYLRRGDAQYIPLFLRLQYHNVQHLHLTRELRLRALNIITTYYRLHIPQFPKLQSFEVLTQLMNE